MANNTLNISPPFKFEVKTPPRGMTDYDPAAIHPEQQRQLNDMKIQLRRDNMRYAFGHPIMKGAMNRSTMYIWTYRLRKVYRAIGRFNSMPEPVIRRDIKRILRDEIYKVEDELQESDIEDWDY